MESSFEFLSEKMARAVKRDQGQVLGGWIRAIVIDHTQGYKPFV
jgi:hypothetical protein